MRYEYEKNNKKKRRNSKSKKSASDELSILGMRTSIFHVPFENNINWMTQNDF